MTKPVPTFHLRDLLDQFGPDMFVGFPRKIALYVPVMRSIFQELIARREIKPSFWLWRKVGDPIWNLSETDPKHLKGTQDVDKFEIKPLYEDYVP